MIYANLVVAEDPVQYDQDFETLSCDDTFSYTALSWLFPNLSNAQIAQEALEVFYKCNTFLIYTHDIPSLIGAKVHTMSLRTAESAEPAVQSTDFEAGAWVRSLAVRVGWHSKGDWFPDPCCQHPADDLQMLLEWDSLRSVIIDARFGSWPYGRPNCGWRLLIAMNEKWGENFRIYNDQRKFSDTRRYTSDRRDISFLCRPDMGVFFEGIWLPRADHFLEAEEERGSEGDDQEAEEEPGNEGVDQEAEEEPAFEDDDQDAEEEPSTEGDDQADASVDEEAWAVWNASAGWGAAETESHTENDAESEIYRQGRRWAFSTGEEEISHGEEEDYAQRTEEEEEDIGDDEEEENAESAVDPWTGWEQHGEPDWWTEP